MLPAHQLDDVKAWLDQCHQPVLFSHTRPDGDALGSLAAMSMALQQFGVEPAVALFSALPPRYPMLADSARWLQWDEVKDHLARDADSVVILDTCALAQLEPALPYLARAPRTLVIDHHATMDAIGTRDGDLRLLDETASATALMVAEWIHAAGLTITREIATALFVGIATDCGWFRFSNTDARTLRMAASLVEAGAPLSELYSAIYQQDSAGKLRLISRLLERLELLANGELAVMRLRQADFRETGADPSMTEDLVNEATRLGGVEATLLFTEDPDGEIRVNFRSKTRLDVSQIARRYGGGGHTRAAGARLRGEWDKVVPRVIEETAATLTD